MTLSLVVATVDRVQELHKLFEGFATQPYRDFEVILVDQNADDRLGPLEEEFRGVFPLLRIRSSVRKVSHARNVGFAAARGELVGFPDDDCWFQQDTMTRIHDYFSQDPELVFLAGPGISTEGKKVNGRWTEQSEEIDLKNVWTTICGFSMWFRTPQLREIGGFDENIGPGTPWGSAEEPDMAIRLLHKGYRGYYDVTLGVFHPDKSLSTFATNRAFYYGTGMGRVLRKHATAAHIALPYFIRPIGGILLSLLRAQLLHARYYWGTLCGRLFGYMAKPALQ